MKSLLFLLFSLILTHGCQKTGPSDLPNFTNLPTSSAFAAGKMTGKINGKFVKELSGLAPSRRQLGAFWTHGDGPIHQIFLIDSLGEQLATLALPENLPTFDCEDIETGLVAGKPFIFLADIGDNNLVESEHRIFKIEEPILPVGSPRPALLDAPENVQTLVFSYPNREPFNAESLLFEAKTGDLYVATKGETAQIFRLAAAAWSAPSGSVATAEHVAELPIFKATGGDLSADGREILLKNKEAIFYWKVAADSSIQATFLRKLPEKVPYQPEIQGEAICFNAQNTGFFTSTERAKASEQPIWFYARR